MTMAIMTSRRVKPFFFDVFVIFTNEPFLLALPTP